MNRPTSSAGDPNENRADAAHTNADDTSSSWQRADAWINARLDRHLTPTDTPKATATSTANSTASDSLGDSVPADDHVDLDALSLRERRRVADLQLLDALLSVSRPSRKQAVERALEVAFARLNAEPNRASSAVASSPVEVAGSSRPRHRFTPRARRAWIWIAAVATVAMLAILGWQPDPSRSAYAMVTRWERQVVAAVDRTYRVSIEPSVPLMPRREARFYVRGGRTFVFDDPGPLGVRLLFGFDGQRRWRMTSTGPAYLPSNWPSTGSSRDDVDNTRAGALAANAPYLQLDSLLNRLRERYDLRSLPRETRRDDGRQLDRVAARLAGSKSGLLPLWPETVDVWASSATGVIERLELRWPAGSLPAGPRSLVFELDSERPLGDRFFEAEFHSESSP